MTTTTRAVGRTAVSPETVWGVLGDYFALASWSTQIDHSSAMTAAEAGLGASRRVTVGSAESAKSPDRLSDDRSGHLLVNPVDVLRGLHLRVRGREL